MTTLSHDSADRRRQAVLQAIKSAGPRAEEQLIAALRDDDPLVREWAVEGLVRRKFRKDAPVAALVACLKTDRRADLRWYAARALGKLGISNEDVRASLVGALDDPDEYVRCFAAWAIGNLRIDQSDVVDLLRQRLLTLRRASLEAHSVGVTLARLNTEPTVDDEHSQGVLFEMPPQVDQLPAHMPQTKQVLIDDLTRTSDQLRMDRMGAAISVKGSLVMRMRYGRSQAAKERVVSERGPSCQICNFRFRKRNNVEYYESHHIVAVSAGGDDDGPNILVLCSNHHRQLHYANIEWPEGMRSPKALAINGERYPIRWHK